MEDNERSRSIEQLPVPEESVMHVESAERSLKTHEIHISLGINISILVMLTIFGVLLFLPLRLLLNTTYYSRNQSIDGNDTGTMNATSFQTAVIPVDHRKLKRCPKLDYNEVLLSVFHCDYDTNCTYTPSSADDDATRNDVEEASKSNGNKSEVTEVSKETVEKNLTECTEDSGKDRRSKSVPVAGHILVTMLLISAIAALVEVLRIRFARDKVQDRRRLFADPHFRRNRPSKLLARLVVLRLIGCQDASRQRPRKKSEFSLMHFIIAHA
ncbi:uncharacterized protein LOC116428517 isoform X2 [Nomia melanderi]|uniref:uncharacterized protein LOC116428517 isoform X2 n=1 Tax=Nomia melanderi TaxID=2448451 RepID=UPI003FCC71A2